MSSKDRILASRCVMPLDCIHHMGYGMVGCHQQCFVSNRELLTDLQIYGSCTPKTNRGEDSRVRSIASSIVHIEQGCRGQV